MPWWNCCGSSADIEVDVVEQAALADRLDDLARGVGAVAAGDHLVAVEAHADRQTR